MHARRLIPARTWPQHRSGLTALEVLLGIILLGMLGALLFHLASRSHKPRPPATAPQGAHHATSASTTQTTGTNAPQAVDTSAGPTDLATEAGTARRFTGGPGGPAAAKPAPLPSESTADKSDRASAHATRFPRYQPRSAPDAANVTTSPVARFREALQSADPSTRFGADQVQQLTATEIEQCLASLADMEWGPQTDRLFQDLMVRWAQLDPAAAATYALGIESRFTRGVTMNRILEVWSRADPQAALTWFLQHGTLDSRAAATSVRTLFTALARVDPAQALARAWSLSDPALKRPALSAVVERLVQSENVDSLLAVYRQMVPGQDRVLLAEALVAQWARYQPERAAEWVLQSVPDGRERERAISRLVSAWGYDQPQEAADWVASLPAGALRRSQLGRVVQMWVQDDPTAANAWLAQQPLSSQTDLAVQSLALGIVRDSPAAAMDWATRITDGRLRTRVMQQVAYEWLAQDRPRAEAYIRTSTLPQTVKNLLLKR